MTALDWIVILVLPFAWTAFAELLRPRLRGGDAIPDDNDEKRILFAMLAPVAFGIALVIVGRLTPMPLPPTQVLQSLPTWLGTPVAPAPEDTHKVVDFARWLTFAGASLYGVGVARMAWPLVLAMISLHRIVTASVPTVSEHGIFYLTEAKVPPLAWGRDRIVLPRALCKELSPEQLRLIVCHELAHLGRRDPIWFAWLSVLDALFWFNPFLRRQTQRCRIAAEIACDAAVIRAAPAERETYAKLLLGVLKHFAADALPGVPAMALSANSGDYRMRLEEILRDDARTGHRNNKALNTMLIITFLSLVGAQLAWSQPQAHPATATADNSFKGFWTNDMLLQQDKVRGEQDAQDPANLHRHLAAEPRDAGWANVQEQAIYAYLAQYHADGTDKVLAIARCGSTMCEVDLKFGFKATATHDQVRAANGKLYQGLMGLHKAVPGFTNGSTTSRITTDVEQKSWPDTIAVGYYQRKASRLTQD